MLNDSVLFDLADCTENDQGLISPSFVLTQQAFEYLQKLDASLSLCGIGMMDVLTEFGTDLSIKEPLEQVNIGINVTFSISITSTYPIFFSQRAFTKKLKSVTSLENLYGLLFTDESFKTLTANFRGETEVLLGLPLGKEVLAETGSTVEKYVKSLNEEAISFLPKSAQQWLSISNTIQPKFWKSIASAKLLCTLCAELFIDAGVANLTFRSDRRVTIKINLLDDELLLNLYDQVQAIATWIYQEGKDAETRHTIFNNQVGFLSITDIKLFDEDFTAVAKHLLESSMLAYRYFIQTASKELSKSLTEINKTLFEHTNKIRQNTVDIVNSLWRDFTTAFGLLILNFSLKKPDISGEYWNWMLVGLLIYLCISYYLSSSVGFWFYYRLKASLVDMQSRIYSYLTEDEFNVFALNPLKGAQRKFIWTFWLVLICYVAIIFLVWQCIHFQEVPKGHKLYQWVENTGNL